MSGMGEGSESFFLIKGATGDLIKRCGGVVRAGEVCSYSRNSVSRWGCRNSPDLIPLSAALALEADCGAPLLTAAMARLNGLALTAPLEDGPEAKAPRAASREFGRAAEMAGQLMVAGCEAMADGQLTPAEAQALRAISGKLGAVLGEFNGALARVEAGAREAGAREAGGAANAAPVRTQDQQQAGRGGLALVRE